MLVFSAWFWKYVSVWMCIALLTGPHWLLAMVFKCATFEQEQLGTGKLYPLSC